LELLLSASSTYDKKNTLPGKQKRAVYTAASSNGDGDGGNPYDDIKDGDYYVFQVDTDISDIMAYIPTGIILATRQTLAIQSITYFPLINGIS
jgi:hypothetical protein